LWATEGLLHRPWEHHRVVRAHPPGWAERGIPSLVTSVARGMRRFPDIAPVQAGGCAVLWRVATGLLARDRVFNDDDDDEEEEGDRMDLVLTALARWPGEVDVQAYCLSAVALFGDSWATGLMPQLIITPMQDFPDHDQVQYSGCSALGRLEGLGEWGVKAWEAVAGGLDDVRVGGEAQVACCRAVTAMVGRTPVAQPVSGVMPFVAHDLSVMCDPLRRS
jgi:hypothetical protein